MFTSLSQAMCISVSSSWEAFGYSQCACLFFYPSYNNGSRTKRASVERLPRKWPKYRRTIKGRRRNERRMKKKRNRSRKNMKKEEDKEDKKQREGEIEGETARMETRNEM